MIAEVAKTKAIDTSGREYPRWTPAAVVRADPIAYRLSRLQTGQCGYVREGLHTVSLMSRARDLKRKGLVGE